VFSGPYRENYTKEKCKKNISTESKFSFLIHLLTFNVIYLTNNSLMPISENKKFGDLNPDNSIERLAEE
jgi:hypothetical protein